MKDGVRIINIARGGLVNNEDVLAALKSGKISCMVTDFAAEELLNQDKVIVLPHLGASTPEAEDNCAIMAADQIKDFLENGNIVNSVNFPKTYSENPNLAEAIILKNRKGQTGTVELSWLPEYTSFGSCEKRREDDY